MGEWVSAEGDESEPAAAESEPAAPSRSALEEDRTVRTLAELFREHPAWVRAAQRVDRNATSSVYFSHRPGEGWHLERRQGRTRLLPGEAEDPDLAFRFTPAAVERLAAVSGGIGDFAVALFELMVEEDPELRIGFRPVASFARLVRRGYLGLLWAGGVPVLAFGAARGVRTLTDLKRLIASLRAADARPWEAGSEGP